MESLTLLVPEKPDVERDALADAWERRGGSVVRVGRFWDPPAVDPRSVRVYGNDTFCLVLAEKLGLSLLSPADDLLASAPRALLSRAVTVEPLATLTDERFPAFVKPVVPKQFRGAVHASRRSLDEETRGLPGETAVLVSEIVRFEAEARAFVLDGVVRTCAVYEGRGNRDDAARFVEQVVRALPLPRTSVVDVGLVGDAWALVECNATWGAGLNGCDADAVVACVAAATEVGA